MDSVALVALGGNVPHAGLFPPQILKAAIGDISSEIGTVTAISRFFRTPAFPKGSGDDFVNACVLLETDHDPETILDRLHRIEARHGRIRQQRWSERTLDLDLIAYGDMVYPSSEEVRHWMNLPLETQSRNAPDGLLLPHPRLQDRAFVLIPLAEIAPGWVHPLTGESVSAMAAALPMADKAEISPL